LQLGAEAPGLPGPFGTWTEDAADDETTEHTPGEEQ
jgi:hypothetical protein